MQAPGASASQRRALAGAHACWQRLLAARDGRAMRLALPNMDARAFSSGDASHRTQVCADLSLREEGLSALVWRCIKDCPSTFPRQHTNATALTSGLCRHVFGSKPSGCAVCEDECGVTAT